MTRPARSRLAAVVVCGALVVGACGGEGAADGETERTTTEAAVEGVDLFDASVVHDIAVEFDQGEYDALIDAYADGGDKEWMEATVTIDGTTYERAGMRLKGNSSLMGLGRGDGSEAETPEDLPWLIRLDEYVDGQLHQGYADIVVRSNGSTTSLNEAVALDLLDAASLASQEAISTAFSVNGGDAVLRLAIEHPDDDAWQEGSFDQSGALYKAESTGDWSYRGEDPDEYTDVFDQEGGKKVADLTPLIEFLQFINESDDETFAAELEDHLDVEAFATYLAMMDLTENFDDIDGPGNNAYLWWDEESGQFTLVPWDLNLAFGAMGGMGPGGGGFPGGGGPPGGSVPEDLPEGVDPDNPPEGFEPPEGFDPGDLPEGGFPGGAGPGGGRGMFGGDNVLVTRFHENADFEALYQDELERLRTELFGSDTAESLLDARVETLATAPELVDEATLQEETDALRERLEAVAGGG